MAHEYRMLKRDDEVANASPEVADQVEKLQHLLINLGFLPTSAVIDGIFGSITEQAVKDFQRKESLEVDGVVGARTWAALLKISPAEIVITHYPPAQESLPAPSSGETLTPNSPFSLRITDHVTYGEICKSEERRRLSTQTQCDVAVRLCQFLEKVRADFGKGLAVK